MSVPVKTSAAVASSTPPTADAVACATIAVPPIENAPDTSQVPVISIAVTIIVAPGTGSPVSLLLTSTPYLNKIGGILKLKISSCPLVPL